MSYSPVAAVGAGLLSGTVTVLAVYVSVFLVAENRLNVFGYLGSLVPRVSGTGWTTLAGILVYLALSALFGLPHAALHVAFDVESDIFTWGVIFGLGHWVVDGGLVAYLDGHHPGVRSGAVEPVGPFLSNLPMQTLIAFLGLHVLYGMFTGAFYDAFR